MTEWLIVYLVHSSVLLGLAWCLDRRLQQPAWTELTWKAAMIAAILSASLHFLTPVSPILELDKVGVSAAGLNEPAPYSEPVSPYATVGAPTKPVESVLPPSLVAEEKIPQATAWEWSEIALALWVVIVAVRLSRVFAGIIATARLVRGAHPIALFSDHAVDVRQSHEIAAPMAVGLKTILIPYGFEALDKAEQQAALHHERAHIRRKDPLWRLAFRVIWAVLFIQPLNAIAIRRAEEAAEFLSDAHAVHDSMVSPRSLATTLARFARASSPAKGHPMLACAMAEKPVIQRIQQLMENTMSAPRRTFPASLSAVTLAVFATFLLPGFAEETITSGTVIDVTDSKQGSRMTLHHLEDGLEIRVKARGEVRFRDDETGIASISDGGFFDLRTDDGDTRHRLMLEADSGALTSRYWRDGDEQAFDADAQRWLTDIMPELFRQTGFDAERRTGRLLKKGGASAVINEIGQITSDRVARMYAAALSNQATLTSSELDELLAQVNAQIESDLEHRIALESLFSSQELSERNWNTGLKSVEQIQSDVEARMVLSIAAANMPADGDLSAYAEALTHIQSDLEARMAIEAIADRLTDHPDVVEQLARAANDIQSDLEARMALASLAPHATSTSAFAALLNAARDVQSDLESRLLLEELAQFAPTEELLADVATVGGDIVQSDLELRLLLSSVLDRSDARVVRDAVKAASSEISSSLEKNILFAQLAR